MSLQRKRDTLKEAIEVYRSNGTERSLKRIFKIIGWAVTLEECWTLNPDVSGQVQFLYNGTITYEDPALGTYNNNPVISPVGLYGIIFGNEKIYSNGTYADLHDSSGTTYLKNTIYGEEYPPDGDSDLLLVSKAPYIRIIVDAEDYDLTTQDFVDPITGQIYSYSASEQFELQQETINFFLDRTRPANVGIIEISTPFALSDTLPDTLSDSEVITYVDVGAKYDGTLSYGTGIDRYLMGENFHGHEYGNTNISYVASPAPQLVPRSYLIGASGNQTYIPTWKKAALDVTVPADASITIYYTKDDRVTLATSTNAQINWVTHSSWSNVTNQMFNIFDAFAILINITAPSATGTIDVDTTLSH
jgi:Phage tail protein (Tail_P2_I)